METAAHYFVLAQKLEDASRCYLALASRAETRELEIEALYNAYHFAPTELTKTKTAGRLGRALIAKVKALAISTQSDRKLIEDAAQKLEEGLLHNEAAEAWLLLGDKERAAKAYKLGGNVGEMEKLLKEQSILEDGHRRKHGIEEEFESLFRVGLRTEALSVLRKALADSPADSALGRKIIDLESKVITRGRWQFQRTTDVSYFFVHSNEMTLGRDPSCDVQITTVGVSRKHATIQAKNNTFSLSDNGSKNGVRLNAQELTAPTPLPSEGSIRLGDHCHLTFRIEKSVLTLQKSTHGSSATQTLLSSGDAPFVCLLEDATWSFFVKQGSPYLVVENGDVTLNGQIVANGSIELLIGDVLNVGQKDYTVSL